MGEVWGRFSPEQTPATINITMGINDGERPRSDRGGNQPYRDSGHDDRNFNRPQRPGNDFRRNGDDRRDGPPRTNGGRFDGRGGDRPQGGFNRPGGGFGRGPGGGGRPGGDRFGRGPGGGGRFGNKPFGGRPGFFEEEEEENKRPDSQVDFVINADGASMRDAEPPQRNKFKNKKKKKRIRIFLNPWLSRMKLPKLLTKLRYLSPRLARQFVEAGRVRINSRPVTSERYEVNLRKERVTIDEAPCEFPRRCQYLVMNKPRGMVCQPGDEMFDEIVTPGQQWAFPFGRLDRAASGIIILSNDPRMLRMQHRLDQEFHKQYRVLLNAPLNEEELRELSLGVRVDNEYFIPLRVEQVETGGKRMWIDITLLDDTPTSIHRAFKALGREIIKLRRVRIASIDETTIPYGEWRELTSYEIAALDLKRFLPGELPPEPDPPPFDFFERPPFMRRPGNGRPGGPPQRNGRPGGRPPGREGRPGRFERNNRDENNRRNGPPGDGPRPPRDGGDRRPGGPRGEWQDRRERRDDGPRRDDRFRPGGGDRQHNGERPRGDERGPRPERQGGERPRPPHQNDRFDRNPSSRHEAGGPPRNGDRERPRYDGRNERRSDGGGRPQQRTNGPQRDSRYEGMRRDSRYDGMRGESPERPSRPDQRPRDDRGEGRPEPGHDDE